MVQSSLHLPPLRSPLPPRSPLPRPLFLAPLPAVHLASPSTPARELRLGPMDWEKKWHVTPRNLILSVLATMRSARFTSRKGPDDETAVLVFEAESVATWFTAAWNNNSRVGYECCVARPNA
ncbi:hypothetical protein B0H14DRAFT_3875593 [Mycena olivaceomarginata]|nr:hypothetical protein B0H14DRAFT_3875593 [Mycena olivaceomarginata]